MPSGSSSSRLQELAQRLARHHLDHAAEHVGGVAVVPGAARLVGQRQPGDASANCALLMSRAPMRRVAIGLLHQARAEEAVGQARRCGAAGRAPSSAAARPPAPASSGRRVRSSRRRPSRRRRPGCISTPARRDRACLLRPASSRPRWQRLGHRIDAEDVVDLHRCGLRRVALAHRLDIGRLAAAQIISTAPGIFLAATSARIQSPIFARPAGDSRLSGSAAGLAAGLRRASRPQQQAERGARAGGRWCGSA